MSDISPFPDVSSETCFIWWLSTVALLPILLAINKRKSIMRWWRYINSEYCICEEPDTWVIGYGGDKSKVICKKCLKEII